MKPKPLTELEAQRKINNERLVEKSCKGREDKVYFNKRKRK